MKVSFHVKLFIAVFLKVRPDFPPIPLPRAGTRLLPYIYDQSLGRCEPHHRGEWRAFRSSPCLQKFQPRHRHMKASCCSFICSIFWTMPGNSIIRLAASENNFSVCWLLVSFFGSRHSHRICTVTVAWAFKLVLTTWGITTLAILSWTVSK